MRKRVLSLLMALVMCLSMLPSAALAGEARPAADSSADPDSVYTVDGDAAPEDGIALLADAPSVVSVTINGETTEYSDIFAAFASAEKAVATITLLDNVYLREDEKKPTLPGKIELMTNASITLDLNGHTITHADIGYTDFYTVPVISMWAGTLTITGGGTIHGMYNTAALSVSGGTVTIDDGITVKGDFAYGEKEFYGTKVTDKARAISVNRGRLIVKGGAFDATSGVALEYMRGTVQLYGGSFGGVKIATKDYFDVINEGVTVVDLLAPGRTYRHTDGTEPADYYVQTISDVKVVEGLVPVPYVDESGAAATAADYIQLEPDTTQWHDGIYVVRGNVTIPGDVTVSGGMPSLILCDGASLTINGGITLPNGYPGALTIYGQTDGTGTMTVTNQNGAAFSCGDLAVLRLLRGTLTASGRDTAFSNVITWNQTGSGNDESKCVATGSEPEVWADGTTVPSVTLSPCTAHQWGRTPDAHAETHLRACVLCGYNENGAGSYEPCVYDSFSAQGEDGHRIACLCGRIQDGAVLTAHTPAYSPNGDGATHTYRCTDCGFVSGTTEAHRYTDGVCGVCGYSCPHEDIDAVIDSATEGMCRVCGKRLYTARLVLNEGTIYETVEYGEDLKELLERYKNGSPVVTLLCDVDMGAEALVVTAEVTGRLLDLNGHRLSGSGDTVFQIYKKFGFTVRNGTIENTGDGDAIQLIRVYSGSYFDGNLTLEDINAIAATGWAVKAAYKENDTEGDVNPGSGELYIRSGTYKGGLNGGAVWKLQISGGVFIANPDTRSIMNPGPVTGPSALQKYLAPGYTYADADGEAIHYFSPEHYSLGDRTNTQGYRLDIWLNADTVTIAEHTSHVIDRDSRSCTICGAPCPHTASDDAGFCTACGVRVMFFEVEGTMYPDIAKALSAVMDRTDDPVVKMLADYTGDMTGMGTDNGYTLDLNGFRMAAKRAIFYANAKYGDDNLTIIDSSEAKTGSVGGIWADGGHVTIRDGSYDEIIASYADSIKITGEGTVKIRKIQMTGETGGSNKKVVADLLYPGYAVYLVDEKAGTTTLVNGYYNQDNTNSGYLQQYLPGGYKDSTTVLPAGQYYTVLPHEHDFADSTQTTCACGKTCTHDSVGADGTCAGCGRVFTASATDAGGNTVYYADGFYPGTENTRSGLDAAFAAASDGSTVTVLGGSSITAYLDGGKTLTLALGGKAVDTIYVGRSEGENSLTVTGTGNIRSLYVHAGNTADLTGWSGRMELFWVYSGGKATLDGGTFGTVRLSGNTAGSLLVPGYAFRYEDGSYVPYAAADDLTRTVSVVPCGYEGWYGSDSSAPCPCCAQTGAIQVPVTGGDSAAQYAFYLTLQAAVGEKNRDTAKAITLLRSISGNCTIDKDVSLDTRGFRIDGALTVQNATVSFSGRGSTVTAVTMSGSEAQFDYIGRGGVTPVMGTLTIADGASWHSILSQQIDRYGYKLHKDGGGYEWKDSDTADADVSSMTNVSIERLPIPKTGLTLWVDGRTTHSEPVGTAVQLKAVCTTDVSVTFYIQKQGSDTPVVLAGQDLNFGNYSAEYQFSEIGRYTVWFVGTKDGYTARSADEPLTITKLQVPENVITPPVPYTDLIYNGKAQELVTPGHLDPQYGTIVFGDIGDQYYEFSAEIPKAANAGTYQYDYLIRGNGSYADSLYPKSLDITIAKRTLTVQDVAVAAKAYDGTDTATFGAVTFDNALDDETPGYRVSGVYSDSGAGGGKTIQITVRLTGGFQNNYMFDNGADSVTFLKTGLSIDRAAAPATEAGTLTILNDVDGTYTFDLSALLPAAPEGTYGAVTYGRPTTALGTGSFVTRVNSVTGLLTLEVSNRSSSTEGVIGTITVDVTTDNYEPIPLTVNVSAQNRPVPVPDGAVTASGITYGQTLGESVLTGTMKVGETIVPGTLTWQYPNAVLNAGTYYDAAWTFTPDDTNTYAEATGTAKVEVDKALQYGELRMDGYTYGETPGTPSLTKQTGDPNAPVTYYYASADSGAVQVWDISAPPRLNAGTYRMFARIDATMNYYEYNVVYCEFVVAQATPVYTVPADLQAAYGQTLADVTLPDGWSWMDGTLSVGDVSAVPDTFKARFTPADTGNYAVVPNIDVPVTVYRADGGSLAETTLTQKYTNTGDHTYTPDWGGLPTGQSWTFSSEASTVLSRQDFAADGSRLTYAIAGGSVGDVITVTLKASCGNYEDFTITLRITLTEKDNQAALRVTGGTTVVYGETLQLGTSGGSGAGAVTYAVTDGTGKATIDANGVLTPVQVGAVTVTATKAGDDAYNDVTSAAVTINITKAKPTGEPSYTPVTGRGKTLKDAALTIEGGSLSLKDGTLEWVDEDGNVLPDDTVIEAGKSYKWRFTPADGNYTAITSEPIKLYSPVDDDTGHSNSHNYRTIMVTVRGNGSVSPSGWANVPIGGDQTFTITPDKGYAVAKVLIDGQSVGAVTSYTFRGVTEGHTIEVIFMKANGNPQTGVDARKFS